MAEINLKLTKGNETILLKEEITGIRITDNSLKGLNSMILSTHCTLKYLNDRVLEGYTVSKLDN